ncbi:MAG: M20/M25/M40 family metallo-hydrolase [Crocinitomicaceae bacterium]
MRYTLFLLFSLSLSLGFSQADSALIKSFYNTALSEGRAHEDLRSLCKDIGARLSGSAEAAMAIEWGKKKMESYDFDKVYLQEIMVPHWERGTTEAGWIRTSDDQLIKVHLLALGGSIGTDGLLEAEVVSFNTLDELKEAKSKDVEGKIVFLNQHMDEKQINTFRAYGGCYAIRGFGAVESSKLGAKAVLIRSLGLPIDDHPHTGSMYYIDSVEKIPAAALSTKDADKLAEILSHGKAKFVLEMDCRDYPDVVSYNVIGEITGSKNPNNIITFGGHLDSWDTGEGAHDDGAGIVHCLEALRLIKVNGYKPNNTLRLVFFMNEENGNKGGKSYATWAKEQEHENHIAALESDRGGFAPRGFHCDGPDKYVTLLKSFEKDLTQYDLHVFEKGYGGVDIGPLKGQFEGIPLFGFVPDSQRYFDFHHAPSDVFENVNKRELELGCAAIASMLYLLDQNL